jgi:hypothetical protein
MCQKLTHALQQQPLISSLHRDRQAGAGPVFDSGFSPRNFHRRQPFGQSGARTQSFVTLFSDSHVGGKLEPLERLDVVPHDALSKSIEDAKVVHGRRISDLRAAQEPASCDGEILRNISVSKV